MLLRLANCPSHFDHKLLAYPVGTSAGHKSQQTVAAEHSHDDVNLQYLQVGKVCMT